MDLHDRAVQTHRFDSPPSLIRCTTTSAVKAIVEFPVMRDASPADDPNQFMSMQSIPIWRREPRGRIRSAEMQAREPGMDMPGSSCEGPSSEHLLVRPGGGRSSPSDWNNGHATHSNSSRSRQCAVTIERLAPYTRGTVSRTAAFASSSDSKMCGATPRFASVSPSLACMKALVVKRVTPWK